MMLSFGLLFWLLAGFSGILPLPVAMLVGFLIFGFLFFFGIGSAVQVPFP
jgi:hypothetical protein